LQYTFINSKIYFPLFFFINDVYKCINKLNLEYKEEEGSVQFIVKDMNFFLEKKNSLGFFNLKHNVVFELTYDKLCDKDYLLSLFKLKI
jgi:hypothetical protein